jgi:hypothetical protein
MLGTDELPQSVYWNGIAAQLAAIDADERCTLIFVHGYNVSTDHLTCRTRDLSYAASCGSPLRIAPVRPRIKSSFRLIKSHGRYVTFHMWTAPSSQGVLQCFDQIALRPYVRPVCALAHERWPRWFPRREFQTNGRPHRGPLENAGFLSSWID